jgi:hypothetical protein
VPDLVLTAFPNRLLSVSGEKEGRSVERVERVDQKVEWHSLAELEIRHLDFHLMIAHRVRTVAGFLAVLAHHDHQSLNRRPCVP